MPNPNNGIFTVELITSDKTNLPVQITVTNFLGNKVYSALTTENKLQLNLSANSKGIYFVQAQNNNHLLNQKIIIQ